MAKWNWDVVFRVICALIALVAFVLAIGAPFMIFAVVSDSEELHRAMVRLTIIISYEMMVLFLFFSLIVLVSAAFGKIDLLHLLSEPKLIFTYVCAPSIFLLIVANGAKAFPAIPAEYLALLGVGAAAAGITAAAWKGTDSRRHRAPEGEDRPAAAAPPGPPTS